MAILVCHQIGFARNKILVIGETNCLQMILNQVWLYCNAVEEFDHKKTEVIAWTNPTDAWQALRDRLQVEYFEAKNAGDELEGAVLIGDVCVPQAAYNRGGGVFDFSPPMDHFLMDIVDKRSSPPVAYTNDDVPFPTIQVYFTEYFTGSYSGGDSEADIWISRINAVNMPTLREGNDVKDEYRIYSDYLQKVIDRMNEPASVPSRGFVMGGPEDRGPVNNTLGGLQNLNLPWYVEFEGPEQNTPYNWMSQLLAGPRGTITYGSFNGTLFPTSEYERNRRSCRYNTLNVSHYSGTATPTSITVGDSSGWEWAGLFNHSHPGGSNFYSNGSYKLPLNGRFWQGTFGPNITLADRMTDGGYQGEYFRYYTDPNVANPYSMNMGVKLKKAMWRWPINTDGQSTKNFDIYLSYVPSPSNDPALWVTLHEVRINANGVPYDYVAEHNIVDDTYSQTDTQNDLPQQYHAQYPGCWHKVKFRPNPDPNYYVTLHEDNLAIVSVILDRPISSPVYRIADAVLFISTDGTVVDVVDDSEPNVYPEQDNSSHHILSTRGFAFNDYINRNYEDMGSEPGGGGVSKTQFFMFDACDINNFLEYKNIGMMYALGHNGLINMGAGGPDYQANGPFRTAYIEALATGMDFGQAFIYALNNSSIIDRYGALYNLLGAGSLQARSYIQYGTVITEDLDINSGYSTIAMMPILIRNVIVNDNGDWDVSCSSALNCTHSEIVIRPETVLSPAGSNEVHLVVN